MKPIVFVGSSLDSLRRFPEEARRALGFQLDLVQRDREPSDWKPMASVGSGAREIRVRSASGAFRVVYIASFREAIYVLHAFQKKSQATSKRDINLARDRYSIVMRSRQE